MGKQRVNILIFVTALFAAFLSGFFVGRNYNHSQVQVSALAVSLETTIPEETTLAATELLLAVEDTSTIVTEPATEIAAEAAASNSQETAAEIPETQAPAQTEATEASEAAPQTQAAESPAKPEPETVSAGSGLININTASAALLETLPGIGEVLAQRIVDYRNTYGPFQSVYALTNVKGIGEKRLAAIINLITV